MASQVPPVRWVKSRRQGKRFFMDALRNRDDWIRRVRQKQTLPAPVVEDDGDEVFYEDIKEGFADTEDTPAAPNTQTLAAVLICAGVALLLLSHIR